VYYIALAVGFLAFLILGVLALFAEPVLRLFTADPETIAVGVPALRILALSQLFLLLGMVMDGGLTGAGDTVSPMVVNIIVLWLIQLPAVWFLSQQWGWDVYGIWWGMVIGRGVQALLMAGRFRQGRWQYVLIYL
jgi:Na+-driven multidrug efflux pump